MATINAFRAVRYNRKYFNKLGSLICPPYDVISPAHRKQLVSRNGLNIVRLELPVSAGRENPYRQASSIFKQWMRNGTLVKDTKPALYVYEQRFTISSKTYCRRGVFSAVNLEKPLNGSILPHETTLSKPEKSV